MCRIAFVIASLALVCPAMETLVYGQANYFPLAQGDTWIYECTGSCGLQTSVTVLVGPRMNFNGLTYSEIQGWFGANYWVREDSDGKVWVYDTSLQHENLWYTFGTNTGGAYSESIPSTCCGQAKIQSKNLVFHDSAGSYDTVLEIDYPGVSQTGISRESFIPNVGLLSRTALTGGFIAKYDLIYSRLGGVTALSRPGLSTGLSLDHAVYSLADSPVLTARLSVFNGTRDSVSLTFSTSERYDFQILDSKGKLVYQWSNGRAFAQVMTRVSVQNEMDYVTTVPLASTSPGNYVARGWLTAIGPPQAYSATTSFQVK
jgi:Intracellular proteinase inhibitor